MWKKYISDLLKESKYSEPILEDDIFKVEQELNIKFPYELRSLLLETNGVEGEFGTGLIWSLDRIKKENLLFRNFEDFKELYMPFDCLLFFADDGSGDQFAYRILNSEIRSNEVFAWNHENDSRIWVANSMKQYIEWWIKDIIEI